jgi:hypothetical protein
MKKLSYGILALLGLFSLKLANAQTAEDIINKNIEAMGGREKLKSVKSLQVESSLEVMGNDAPATRTVVDGKAFKSETDFNGQKIIQCITDTGGWAINPMMGQTSAEPLPREMLKGSKIQTRVFPLLDYAASGNKVELVGRDSVNGVNAYKVKFATPDSVVITYFFDPVTYLLLKAVSTVNVQGQDAETTIAFSNYQKTDFGVMWAMTEQITIPQGITLTITHKKVDINKEIDPKIFQMPKS